MLLAIRRLPVVWVVVRFLLKRNVIICHFHEICFAKKETNLVLKLIILMGRYVKINNNIQSNSDAGPKNVPYGGRFIRFFFFISNNMNY